MCVRVVTSAALILALAPAGLAGPARLVFDEKATHPFPTLITGVQEEVYHLPYASRAQFDSFRRVGLSVLRYPCGTPSDWLAWDDIENGYWPSEFEKKRRKLYPDQYISLCRTLGVEPLITVNTTLAGPHDERFRINPTRVQSIRMGAAYAARWVRHANVKNKSGVKYWEIGNEVWVWMTAEENAAHVREYAAAMRKVDPSIKIIACGEGANGAYKPVWLNFPDDPDWRPRTLNKTNAEHWTKTLLTKASGSFDYIAVHMYLNGRSLEPVANGRELFAKVHSDRRLARQVAWLRESGSNARLAVTEWMVNVFWEPANKHVRYQRGSLTKEQFEKLNSRNSPLDCFVTGLAGADFLGKMISSGYVDIAVAHTMFHGVGRVWDPKYVKANSPALIQPVGEALAFWRRFRGDRVAAVRVADSPTYEHGGRRIPLLSAYATRAGENTLRVILINRSPDTPVSVTVPAAFAGARCKAVTEHMVYTDSWADNVCRALEPGGTDPIRRSTRRISPAALADYSVRPSALICLELTY